MVTTTLLEVVGAMNACVSGDADSVATAAAADRIGKKDLMDDVNFCTDATRFKLLRIGEPPNNKSDPCPLDIWVYIAIFVSELYPLAPPATQIQNYLLRSVVSSFIDCWY